MIINFNFLVLNPHIRMDHMELTAAHDDVTLEIWNLKFEIWKFSCNYVSNLERISSSQVSYCEHIWFLLTNATFNNYSVNRNPQVAYKQYNQLILYSGETMDRVSIDAFIIYTLYMFIILFNKVIYFQYFDNPASDTCSLHDDVKFWKFWKF